MRTFDQFEWYGNTPEPASPYRMVVCDGPPGNTQGGRYGLLPVMQQLLAEDVHILLDDVHRRRERRVLDRWKTLHPLSVQLRGFIKRHACARGMQPAPACAGTPNAGLV